MTKQGDGTNVSAAAFFSSMEEKLGGVPYNFAAFKSVPVVTGEDVTDKVTMFGQKIRISSGLSQQVDRVIATQVGILRFEQPNIFWVDHHSLRYRPRLEDNVVGVITEKFGESYHVDILGTTQANLSALAFDGASKRNRPNLEIGTLIYARVAQVSRFIDPELSCQVAGSGVKKDWMTGQSVYGELKGGYPFRCSTSLASRLLDPECPVLMALGKSLAFEIAIGANGVVWISAEGREEMVVIANTIKKSDFLSENEIVPMVQTVVKKMLTKKKNNE